MYLNKGGIMLSELEAQRLVENYMKVEGLTTSTQDILDSGEIPRLKGYTVRPGKVSDSIFSGRGSFAIDKEKEDEYRALLKGKNITAWDYFTVEEKGKLKEKVKISFENPPLNTYDETPLRVMVRTQRISTHDITRGEIPFKDQILALNHHFMWRLLRNTLGTSQYEVPGLSDNSVVIAAENLQQIAFENVFRAYMAKSTTDTSLYQAYVVRGERKFAGHDLPEGLFGNGPLPYVMDTPSTKSDIHDITVDPQYLFDNGICTPQQYKQIVNSGLVAFGIASYFLRERGIIAVDTKTEHGINMKGEIVSQDEIWTMDSSRFWLLDDYNAQMERFLRSEIPEINPRSFSKEFARGFSEGDKGYTEEQRIAIAVRYIIGIQHLLGQRFEPDMRTRDERVIKGLETVVEQLIA